MDGLQQRRAVQRQVEIAGHPGYQRPFAPLALRHQDPPDQRVRDLSDKRTRSGSDRRREGQSRSHLEEAAGVVFFDHLQAVLHQARRLAQLHRAVRDLITHHLEKRRRSTRSKKKCDKFPKTSWQRQKSMMERNLIIKWQTSSCKHYFASVHLWPNSRAELIIWSFLYVKIIFCCKVKQIRKSSDTNAYLCCCQS